LTEPLIISEPGAYPDIQAEDYHDREICDAPSISSSGLKLITAKSPRHYWAQSKMNPDRPARKVKPHFNVGHALHDLVLLNDRFKQHYHITPPGFNDSHTRKWEEEIEARDYAVRKGKQVITTGQFEMAHAMAESIAQDELAGALLTAGTPEMTLAAKDEETGVWIRARPDILPHTMEIIPDLKTAADASLDVYERAATRFGYFQSAAHYLDVIDALYGEAKRRFVLITVEKEYPYVVTIDHLDDVDIDFARLRNRHALNRFAECLKSGHWPAYTSPERPIRPLQMANYERSLINQAIERGELSYS
jgi:hypothetical protein